MLKNMLLASLLLGLTTGVQARSLLDGDYVLSEWRHAGVTLSPPPAATLSIYGDRLNGFSGCNRFFGKISTLPKLKLGPLASTRMACPDEALAKLEPALLSALETTRHYQLSQTQHLVLKGAKGERLVWQRQSDVIEQLLYIAPERKSCTGVVKMDCLQVRESPTAEWSLFYSQIEGFDYVPGKSYKIKVRREKVANPPADASAFKYVLLEVLGD